MAVSRRFAAAIALAATISMSAGSALAVDLPAAASPAAVYQGEKAQNHRWYPRYRRNRVDGGDVLAGVLILGTIAAVANAAKSNRDRDYRYPDRREPYPRDSQRYDDRRGDDDSRGLDRAVDMCVDEVERGSGEVDVIDGANRTADGWTVRGQLEGGAPFTCNIGNDGRIRAVDISGARAEAAPVDDRQYGADVYARARAAGPGTAPTGGVDERPEWTGDRAQAPAQGDDGRYGVSGTPDFEQVG